MNMLVDVCGSTMLVRPCQPAKHVLLCQYIVKNDQTLFFWVSAMDPDLTLWAKYC